ncbi:MAG: polysaccharide biosynthesis/export family protein [Myxococcales bacterium]|nr:polysaccharide biosynthesis/export family protein [Myxococcales bacterium]
MIQGTSPKMRVPRRIGAGACVLLLLLPSACSSVGKRKLPPPEEVMAQQRGPIRRGEYRLMAGDKLSVKFPYHHARDQELPVRPDGMISLDVTGEILAEGRTPLELAEIIKQRSSRYLKNPEVVVIVIGIGDRRVYVGGEVNRPGFVTVQEGMTPLQAVMAVGGFKDTAQKQDVLYIARDSNGDYNASRVDLEDVVTNGTPEVVRLSGNDIVFVPASRIANAGIFVKQYIREILPVESRAGATAPIPIP